MKVHRYELTDYRSFGIGEEVLLETRLYIPECHTVLISNERNRDFSNAELEIVRTSTDSRDIEQAKKCIAGHNLSDARYIGIDELPKEVILEVISNGRMLNSAKHRLRRSSMKLCELV